MTNPSRAPAAGPVCSKIFFHDRAASSSIQAERVASHGFMAIDDPVQPDSPRESETPSKGINCLTLFVMMEFSASRVIANWGMQYRRTAITANARRPQVTLRGIFLEISFGLERLSGAGEAITSFDYDDVISDVDDCGRKAWGLLDAVKLVVSTGVPGSSEAGRARFPATSSFDYFHLHY